MCVFFSTNLASATYHSDGKYCTAVFREQMPKWLTNWFCQVISSMFEEELVVQWKHFIDLKIQCKDTEFFIRQDFQLAYLRSKFRQPCHLAIQSRECMNSITLHKYRLKKLLKTMQSLTYTRKEVYKCFKTPRKLLI